MKKIISYHLLVILLLGFVVVTYAQDYPSDEYYNTTIEKRAFDAQNWERTIDGIDYTNGLEKDRPKSNSEQDGTDQVEPNNRFEIYKDVTISGFWATVVKFIFITILALMLAFLIYHIIKGENLFKPKNKKIKSQTAFDLEKVEENLHDADLVSFIEKAEAEKNYNLAIRLYYLAIIKELSLGKLIKWKRDKTNRTYIRELNNHNLKTQFRKATNIFERVWYGDGILTQENYLVLKPQFQQWIQDTKNNTVTSTT